MLTATYEYAGSGRVLVSPAPHDLRRGYRVFRPLFLRAPPSEAEVAAHLRSLDPHATWAELHRLVYPHEPVLLGGAAPDVLSYRTSIARWLTFWGYAVTELVVPETHRARRVHPRDWRFQVGAG